MIFHENRLLACIMPYLLFLKKQQNLKLSSAANHRLHFMGLILEILPLHSEWQLMELLLFLVQYGSE